MKIIYCVLGITLLISSLYLSYLKKDDEIFIRFHNLLDDKQKKEYNRIIVERITIYVIGIILGLVIGIYYLLSRPNDKYKLCKFLCIVYLIKLSVYYFYPKSKLMLYSLSTEEQVKAWADIYTEMKNRWKKSLMVGFFGYIILSFMI